METFVSSFLAVIACLLAIPVSLLFLEIMAAAALPRQGLPSPAGRGLRQRVAILVPAHNESSGLLPTVADIKAQLRTGDRILVVADNCSDDTASVAAAAAAEVVVRNDLEKIGKGYALAWGLRHLSTNPPDIVIVIDADCRLSGGAIDRLSAICTLTGRPAQGLYLMKAPDQVAMDYRVAQFAWRVKNWVRPLGLSSLGLPCQLTGTGMAFPWAIIRAVKLASGEIVEDLNLGLDLALAGSPPMFCPEAEVSSTFPTSAVAADHQRQRWEQGHVDLILARAPRLIASAIVRRDLGLFVLALDLAVPPLVLLGLLTAGVLLLASLVTWLGGSPMALIISAVNLLTFTAAIVLSWITFARDILPPRVLWSVAPYAVRKFDLYRRVLSGSRISQWIRTDRK